MVTYSFPEAMMDPVRSPALSIDALLANRGWVRALALSLVRDEHHADDLVQQTWLRALQSPPTRAESVRGWLATIVRNLARDRWRSEGRRAAREHAAARRCDLPATADLVARAEAHRALIRHVTHLREPYRTVVLLRFFEDLPPRDIAQRLGIPAPTVRTRLHRALVMLRERLEHEDGSRGSWQLALLPLPGAALTKGAASGAAPALVGGLVVTAKQKIVLFAALLLLLCGGVAFVVTRPPTDAPQEETAAASAEGTGRDAERRHVTAPAAPEATDTAEEATEPAAEDAPPAAPPPAAPARSALPYTLLRYVQPRAVPKGYTELAPGEDPVIEDAGEALGGARGPRLLPYWSRWAPVPPKGTATVRGRVTDASGRGIAGAEVYRVRLDESGRRESPSSYQWVKEIAQTDEDGRFEATEQPAGEFLIAADYRATMRRRRGLDLAGAVQVALRDDQAESGVDIALPVETARLGTVRGVVLDENGEPRRNAEVWGPLQRNYTDAEGRFEMGGLQPGTTTITARATGYARLRTDVDVLPGATRELTLQLELAETGDLVLEGIVVDRDGKPVPNAPLFLAASMEGSRYAAADENGVFRIEGLSSRYAEEPVQIMVVPHPERDLFRASGPPVKTTLPAHDVRLVVERTARLHVVLRDAETEEPLTLYAIDVERERTNDGETAWGRTGGMSVYDEDGEAAFSVAVGRVRLTIRAKDHRGMQILVDVPPSPGPKEVLVAMERE